jgi:hypothetical protein
MFQKFTLTLALLVVLLSAGSAFGGDVLTDLYRDTKIITLTGLLDFQVVWREDFFDSIFPRNNHPGPYHKGTDQDELFINPILGIKFKAELPERFFGTIALRTLPDAYGAEQGLLSQNTASFHIQEASIGAEEFISSSMDLFIGLLPVKVDLRENGDCFFINVQESENPFTGAVHTDPAVHAVPASVTGIPVPLPGSGYSWNGFLGGNAWWNNYAGQSMAGEFGGMHLRVNAFEDAFTLDVYAGYTMETGLQGTDGFLFLATPQFEFDLSGTDQDKSKVLAYMALIQGDKDTALGALGFGFDLWFYKDWFEVFCEYVGQFGEYTSETRAMAHDVTHQSGNAFYAGVRFEPKFDIQKTDFRPFFEISYWWVSGDDGNALEHNRDFVSFEDVDTLLIMESNDVGLDVDCNYRALKWEIGFKLEVFEFSVRYGMFYIVHGPHKPTFGYPGTSDGKYDKLLGNEVDVRFTFKLQEHVEITAVAAILFDAEFWDQSTESRGLRPLPWHGSGTDAGLGLLEFKLKF